MERYYLVDKFNRRITTGNKDDTLKEMKSQLSRDIIQFLTGSRQQFDAMKQANEDADEKLS